MQDYKQLYRLQEVALTTSNPEDIDDILTRHQWTAKYLQRDDGSYMVQ